MTDKDLQREKFLTEIKEAILRFINGYGKGSKDVIFSIHAIYLNTLRTEKLGKIPEKVFQIPDERTWKFWRQEIMPRITTFAGIPHGTQNIESIIIASEIFLWTAEYISHSFRRKQSQKRRSRT